jgi:hypothetical protein
MQIKRMKNTDRTRNKQYSKAPLPQAQISAPENKPPITLAFLAPGVKFDTDEPGVILDQASLSEELFWAIHLDAEAKGQSLSEWLEDAVKAKLQPSIDLDNPKTAKGFVQVNLSEREKNELRELARDSGADLRGALRQALLHVKSNLREWARFKLLTGFTDAEQIKFFAHGAQAN